MLTSLTLRNFKAAGPAPLTLPLRPLTVLIGPNGSGKTSVLDALGLIVQSASDQHRSGFALEGDYLRAESEDVLFHRRRTEEPLSIAFTLKPQPLGINAWWTPHPQNTTLSYTVTHARKVPLSLDIFGVTATGDREDWEMLGQDIFHQGDLGDRIYIIAKGEAEVLRHENDKEVSLAKLGAGEYFGEMALLNHTTRNATVRCVQAMDVLSLPKNDFSLLAANLPVLRQSFENVSEQRRQATAKALVQQS